MRTFWIVQAGIAAAAIGASATLGVACGGNVVVDTGIVTETSTETVGGTFTETDTFTGTDTFTVTGTDTFTESESGLSCHECACVLTSGDTPAGCADICDNTISGTTTPNFCNGAPALSQCTLCIEQRCGVSDPTACN